MRLSVLAVFLAGPVFADPEFRRVSPELTHSYTGGWEHFVGGGMAVFDCSGDRLAEIFAAGGEAAAVLLRNRSETGGDVVFEPDTPEALRLTGVTGAYPLDIDSDDIMDLVVLRVGQDVLLRGTGECAFEPFASGLGVETGDRWSTAFSAVWEQGQTLPTLAFGHYVDRSDPEGPFEACDTNTLYRPSGETYSGALTLEPGYCALSMLFTDWGRKGRSDLRISNDRHYYVSAGSEQMWAMEDAVRLYSEADGWRRQKLWGMGIASRDLDHDGLPEVYLTSMGDQILQSLAEGSDMPRYLDAPYDRGTTAQRPFLGDDGRPSTGWHPVFGDVDNDGRDDLFVAKGNVDQMPSNAMADPNNMLMQEADGRFREAAEQAGVASGARSRGAALVDFNGDGLLDLAVLNRRAPIEIYQNATPATGNWLSVDIRQTAPNRRAIGAWIELETAGRVTAREVTVGGGHAGDVAAPQHFGLGGVAQVKVRVVWPDGDISNWLNVPSNAAVTLMRDGDGSGVLAR